MFHNFAQPVRLGYLARTEAQAVLTQPLETLGIAMEDQEKILDDVYTLTSGHPNLVQYAGYRLIEAVNQRRSRLILIDDVNTLRSSNAFIDFFFQTIWGDVGPLEKLITLIAPQEEFDTAVIEAVLKENLFRMRDAIDQFYADKGKYPTDLQALVSDGYIRKVPEDPFTRSADTWQAVPSEPDPNDPTALGGVFDVKSGSDATALDGTRYGDW